jgi:CRP-like cAMP-binding protein
LRPESFDLSDSPTPPRKSYKVKREIPIDEIERVDERRPSIQDLLPRRKSDSGSKRDNVSSNSDKSSHSPSQPKSRKGIKPKVLSMPKKRATISTSDHSTLSMASSRSSDSDQNAWQKIQPEKSGERNSLRQPDVGDIDAMSNHGNSSHDEGDETILPLEIEQSEFSEAPVRRRTWKPKRVISIEEMEAMRSSSDHTLDQSKVRHGLPQHDAEETIEDISASRSADQQQRQMSHPQTSDETNSLRVPDVGDMDATSNQQGNSSHDEGDDTILEMSLDIEPSEFSDAPIRRRTWKPKRVISVEEMKASKDTSDYTSESSKSQDLRSRNQETDGKQNLKQATEPRIENDGSTKTNDAATSPKPHSNTRKSSKLQDRIKMFSKPSSPEPQRAFLGSRYMNKLIQKQEKNGNNGPLATLIEDKPSVVDAPPMVTAKSTEISSNGEPGLMGSHGSGNEDPAAERPKISLDKAVAETKKKQVEKQRSMSIMRRGQLKATRSALVDQKDTGKNAVFANVLVRQEDLSSHTLREFPKHPADHKIILTALRKNFVFEDMEEEDMEKLVAAMEGIKVSKGEEIIRQGDQGDYFYVVSKGEVGLVVDGCKVATVGPGNAFGEIALLYTCPQATTVVAREQPTSLFRVDQKSFRFMMQSETKKSEEEKKRMLQRVPFLSSLSAEDIARLCSVMTPVIFYTGDYIVKKGDKGSSFYIVQEGKVRVTEIFVGGTSYEDIVLEKGDYFGEDALVGEEPRAANVVALTTGRAFSIDRANVRKVLGDFASLISKAQDRQRLVR